jgi:hypothetical protein
VEYSLYRVAYSSMTWRKISGSSREKTWFTAASARARITSFQ